MTTNNGGRKDERPLLKLSPLILGGAGFSYQLVNQPEEAPVVEILEKAFESGVRTIDTSPYYDPSEVILGAALSDPRITRRYRREDYILMTKVGRITADRFDYSSQWIRSSVTRSLQRFQTTYLDVVFCHDVEFVSFEEAVEAVGTLFQLVQEGVVRHAGISGYKLETLAHVASLVLKSYGQPVDVVQTWAQLTLQNTRLETFGLPAFKAAGVRVVCASSPLAVGLLRREGVPVGSLGDWHPAPQGLRIHAQQAAEEIEATGDTMSAVALRYALRKADSLSTPELHISTITGVASLSDLRKNVATACHVLGTDLGASCRSNKSKFMAANEEATKTDHELFELVRRILGTWLDYDLSGVD